jgi:hypothetical protein
MPDAGGNIKGISTSGKAGETLERIFGKREPRSFERDFDLPDIDMDREFFESQLRRVAPDPCCKLIKSGRNPVYCDKPAGHDGLCWSSKRQPCVK